MKISVIVTNFNGLPLLKKNLENVIVNSPQAQEIIVADDASHDDSLLYVKTLQKKYSNLKLISHSQNVGFGKNTNDAVKKSQGDYVVLLNNDILPYKDYLKNSLRHFKNPDVFGVGFSEKGNENFGQIFWQDGYLQHQAGFSKTTHESAWASGGSSIINKKLFLKLGGFDPVYAPFYYEDLDLGLRAWKSGYQILWEPKALIDHRHEATISKFPKRFLDYVKERNRLLVIWRNITDPQLLRQNKLAIISRIIFGPNYIKIVRAAKRQIRLYPPPLFTPNHSDREIISRFSP